MIYSNDKSTQRRINKAMNKKQKKCKNYFDLSDKEKQKLIKRAAKRANEMQREMVEKYTASKVHRIGLHGAIGMVVRKGNKIIRMCCECNKPIVEPEPKYMGSTSKVHGKLREQLESLYLAGFVKDAKRGRKLLKDIVKFIKCLQAETYEKGFEDASKQKRYFQKLYLDLKTEQQEWKEKIKQIAKAHDNSDCYILNEVLVILK